MLLEPLLLMKEDFVFGPNYVRVLYVSKVSMISPSNLPRKQPPDGAKSSDQGRGEKHTNTADC